MADEITEKGTKMINNRTAQLIYLSMFCALAVLGAVASLGIFYINEGIRWQFYVQFTNLSNYYCMIIGIMELIQTAKKKDDSYVRVAPTLKFIGVVMISLTFIVFNAALSSAREYYYNFRVQSVLFHIVIPIMYVVGWILFYEHGKNGRLRPTAPLIAVIAPFIYVVFIYIRAWIVDYDTNVPYLYPYFFLNPDMLGIGGVVKWIVLLLVFYIAMGYIYLGVDRYIGFVKQKQKIERT